MLIHNTPGLHLNKWPADRVERRALEALVPYEKNARTHSDEQIEQIARSMREWGWTNPILVDEGGGVIAGHARILAAKRLGLLEAPVMVAVGWSEAQKRAYVLADNQLAMNAGWDVDLLREEVKGLSDWGFDLSLLGFDDLDALWNRTGLTDPDAVPALPDEPVARPGDLYVLGNHRLLCGDATKAADAQRVLGEAKPHLMVTDPPYGVDYDPDWRNKAKRSDGSVIGAKAVGNKVSNDDCSDWREAWSLFPGDVVYCWHAGRHASSVQGSLEAARFEIVCQIIWAKDRFVISRGDYHWQHEPCWYAVRKGGCKHRWSGDRSQSTLWQIEHMASETGHSAQKPVECMRRPIENNSKQGDAIYDPFVGSGTTIIAAQMMNRACHAIEINPAYVDVAVKRWQDFTGEQARLA